MAKRNRIYRILKIISLLSSRYKKWSAGELSELFDVSVRTIHRDKEIIEEMGIPIYYDTERRTYSIVENYYFQPPDINRDEAIALLLAGQAIEDESFLYGKDIDTAIAKIINSLPESIQKLLEDLEGKISYQQGAGVDINPYRKVIKIIEDTINESSSLIIVYHSLSHDKVKERKINPYSLAIKNGAYYLIGFCYLRSEVRLFRVDRIKDISPTNETFERPENFNVNEYLDDAWGVERNDKKYRVKVIFKDKAARLVQEMNWHQSQRITKIGTKKIRFEVITGSFEEIKSWVLGFGSSAEVLEPKELKVAVREEVGKMKEIYD